MVSSFRAADCAGTLTVRSGRLSAAIDRAAHSATLGSIVEAKSDLERHLPEGNLILVNFATCLNDLKPVHMSDCLCSLRDGRAYRIV